MLALLAIVLVWLLILRPLEGALANARDRHARAAEALTAARADAALVRQLESQPPRSFGAPLETVVQEAAAGAGFPVGGIRAEAPNLVTLASPSVRPQAFFEWVSGMEAQHGLVVERLSASAARNRTLAVQVTFRARGG
jgi:general secretion pathway protein M